MFTFFLVSSGKERNLNIAELLCASCSCWFHESCIGYKLDKLVPFMTNYVFTCKNCSFTGLESFKKNQSREYPTVKLTFLLEILLTNFGFCIEFAQMCVTALANLTQASVKEGSHKRVFSKDKDIIPSIDMHWEGMTTMTRRVTQSWLLTVIACICNPFVAIDFCISDYVIKIFDANRWRKLFKRSLE